MNRTRGFTLFELIISVTIVVMLVATMASTISVAFKQKRAAERALEVTRGAQTVAAILVEDLLGTVPPSKWSASDAYLLLETEEDTTATTDTTSGVIVGTSMAGIPFYTFGPFIGTPDFLSFYTSGPEPNADIQGDVRYVEYALEPQSNGNLALVRRVETNLLADFDPSQFISDIPAEILVTDVQSMELEYFDGWGSWYSEWDSTTVTGNLLPYAVSITLELAPLYEGEEPRIITRFASIPCAGATEEALAETEAQAAAEEEEEVEE